MKQHSFFISFCFCLSLACGLTAQDTLPQLTAGVQGDQREMVLEKLDVSVDILGLISETSLTMTFFNPHDRVLEGELVFPLPDGATVSGYALDVNGQMVDGVAVEKEKARRVFETEVRRGVDPGIVEKTAGNHFRTRIYPLPAKGRRTVMVRYLSELDTRGDSAVYRLPLAIPYPLKQVSFRAEVLGDQIVPQVTEAPLDDLQFVTWHRAFVAQGSREDIKLDGNLVIELPELSRQKVFTMRADDGRTYFYTWDRPGLPNLATKAVPLRRMTLFWDASASRSHDAHQKAYDFLKAFFSTQKQAIIVRLVLVRTRLSEARILTVKEGDSTQLREILAQVFYDGATNLAALADDRSDADLAFLFSDGISTWEPGTGAYLRAPLYTIGTSDGSDSARLRRLAALSGGEFIDLQREQAETAARQIGQPVYKYLGPAPDSRSISLVYPALPRVVRDRILVCGVLEGNRGKLGLTYGTLGKTDRQRDIPIVHQAGGSEGTLLQRYWAQKRIEELMTDSDHNAAELLEVGKRYGLVTSETSLIVLERLDQYLTHRIMPPSTLPQLRAQYSQRMEQMEARRKQREKSKMDLVLSMWRERLAWFKTDFSKPPQEKPEKKHAREQDRQELNEMVAAPTMAADMAAPAPMAERVASRSQEGVARASAKKAEKADEKDKGARTVHVDIKAFDPQTPYLAELKAASKERLMDVYRAQRVRYSESPSFFVDCADYFYGLKMNDMALRVLSNLAEMKLEDPQLLRILAGRLMIQKEWNLARWFYEEVRKMRGEEPQSSRDLALVLGELKEYRRAVELLNEVIFKDWDRFNGIEVIALTELNDVVRRAKLTGITDLPVSPAFLQLIDTDLRIVLTWDADATDIDLHVVEPTGEEVFYRHKLSTAGGLVSNDFTQGYGPEEYLVRKALPGHYKIRAKYYGSQAQRLLGPVSVRVDIITHFGRSTQRVRSVLMRLEEAKEMVDVAEVKW